MKKYVYLASVVCFVVVGAILAQQHNELASKRSVEFSIAELSPDGEKAGYAMPASGGSPPSSVPGCAIAVNPQKTDFNGQISVSWLHGTIPGAVGTGGGDGDGNPADKGPNEDGGTESRDPDGSSEGSFDRDGDQRGALASFVAYAGGGGGSTPAPPVPPDLVGVLEGLSPWGVAQACLVYCNLDDDTCDPDVESHWSEIGVSKGEMLALSENDASFAGLPGIANAGSGGSSCNNASASSKNFTLNATKSGNFVIGIKASYSARYASHHTTTRVNQCSETFSVNTDDKPELMIETNIDTTLFANGQDAVLVATILNKGTGATDHLLAEDGMFNYSVEIDVSNNGFTSGSNDDLTITTEDVLGPLADQYNISDPWKVDISPVWNAVDVVAGTHGYKICADTNSKVTEIQEGNNCASGTFTVSDYDVAAYALPGTYYAVFGEVLRIAGYVFNLGEVAIDTLFNNQIEIRTPGSASSIIDDAESVSTLAVGIGILIEGDGVNHQDVFGTDKSLEYRVWVDSSDSLAEVAPDNVRPDTVGNNDSAGWSLLELVNPELRPENADMSTYTGEGGGRNDYWGPFVFNKDMDIVVDMYNDTPHNLDIGTTFNSILAIDNNNDCGDNVLRTDSCIDATVTFSTNGVAGSLVRDRATWSTYQLGVYRARIYADSSNVLPELNESNNVTPWQTFEVVESLPGEEVSITSDPEIVRKGSGVTLTWDIGVRSPASCRVTKNDQFTEIAILPSVTGSLDVFPTATGFYEIQCDADGVLNAAANRAEVKVIPALYES